MLKKAMFPGKYLQGAGALQELPALVAQFGARGMILAAGTASNRILPASGVDLPVERFGGECCTSELERLAAVLAAGQVDVLVGMGSILLDAAELGDWVILGAGSLVTARTKIPSGVLAMGRPAKVVRALTQEERDRIKEAAELYVGYAKEHGSALTGVTS